MEKTQVFDVSENLTTYVIEKIRYNISIPESSFTFVPPAGVDVVDLR
jgi:outer membrane lipoprotein-sorting protein